MVVLLLFLILLAILFPGLMRGIAVAMIAVVGMIVFLTSIIGAIG